MNILALDTSSKAASCALTCGDLLVAECFVNASITHSQTILPMVEQMLQNCRMDMSQVDAFAVSSGPGSFTGLRIGISAIKGMAMATAKPCVGVSTLEVLAHGNSSFSGTILPVMDARCDQVYTASFHSQGGRILRQSPDEAISLEQLELKIQALAGQPVLLCGDGAALCLQRLPIAQLVTMAPPPLLHQRAAALAGVAQQRLKDGQGLDAERLVPAYLRLPQAQRQLQKQKGRTPM